MAQIISDTTNHPVTIEQAPTPEEIIDQAAVELVKTDAEAATTWIEGNQWNENWKQIDILYDSPRVFSVWEGSNGNQKPTVNRFILAQHVSSIHPQLMQGLFYNGDCFIAEPRPGTEAEVVRARSTVIKVQLDQMELPIEVANGLHQTILHGTGIYKWGLEMVEEEYSEFVKSEPALQQQDALGNTVTAETSASKVYKEVRKSRMVLKPFLRNREIRSVLVNPNCKDPDIRRAGWVVDKFYLTLAEVLDLAKDPNYTLPDEATLKSWAETPKEMPAQLGTLGNTQPGSVAGQAAPDWDAKSEDPYQAPFMILERWDKNKVLTTINNKKCIQNRVNPYGVLPFFSSNWLNRILSFWGLGVGKMVGTDQRLQQGLENAGLGMLNMLLDNPYIISEDANVPTQNIRLRNGGIIKVKGDANKAIVPMNMAHLPLSELFAFLQNSQSKSEAASGANELFSQGAMPGPGSKGTSATRSATGAGAVASASAGRLQGPIDRFINQVFIPWIYQLDELNRRFLMTTPEGRTSIDTILADELGKDYRFDEDGFLSGRVTYSVLAGAHMATRAKAASMLPVITQIFDNPAIQAQLNQINEEYVDMKELLLTWMEMAGLPNRRSLIKKMTPEMKQRQAAMNPGAQKMQAQAAGKETDFQHAQALQQQKGEQGIARDVINRSLDQGGDAMLRQAFENSPETLGE